MNEKSNNYTFKLFKFELIQPNTTCEVPAPRNGHRTVCNLKSLYLFGGYNTKQPVEGCPELWQFNFCSRTWQKCIITENFPDAFISSAVLRKRDKLLTYGGTGVPFAFKCSNKLYSIKLKDDFRVSPITITGKKGPDPQYGQSIVMHKNILYVIGGTDGFTYTCNIHKVNLNQNPRIWRQLYVKKPRKPNEEETYQPLGRYRQEVAFDGENIYIIGGGTVIKSYDLKDIPVFNVRSKRWRKMTSKPDPHSDPEYPEDRRCHGIVQVKTATDIHVYVLGGYQNNEVAFNDLWRLELSTLQWTLIRKDILPKAPYFHSITLTREGKLYVFGGMEGGHALTRNNKMYSAWLYVPKLAEMAWEAVLHYIPNLCANDIGNGLQLPSKFVSRLE